MAIRFGHCAGQSLPGAGCAGPAMTAFAAAMKLTLGFEGGRSNHPADHGGLTNYGITQGAYDRWRRLRKLPTQPVTHITATEVGTIYHDDYWLTAHCDALPDKLAQCQFDACVHSGPEQAIRFLQQALGISADGRFGPQTRAEVAATPETLIIERYLLVRDRFYDVLVEHDPTQAVFRKGWHKRTAQLRLALLGVTTGVA